MVEQLFHPKPGSKVRLSNFDPSDRGDYDRSKADDEEDALEQKLASLQERLYAEGKQALLVVLQAMDAGGKDGTIKHVFDRVNPQGVRVTSFKAPTPEELAHDFLWRVHKQVPAKGYIGIFNRSHYEDVLVVRVNDLVPRDVWEARYRHINQFEHLLADSGVRILKFFLHISKDEQKERFQERLEKPDKHWKFSTGDLPVREKWDDYMRAYEDVLSRCNTDYAPWYIVPANRKWYRNLIVTRTIVEALESMNPQYPPAEPDLDKVVIPD
ncbi:MAG: polyphosphate kinase 2 family protein [Anaerolineae bacterium]|nr:polyphosphate kinase 2 family protein [Anaerolineae bacterium]